MPSRELLWTIQEERRRERTRVARERWIGKPAGMAASIGALVGWVRGRLRVLRLPLGRVVGGTPAA